MATNRRVLLITFHEKSSLQALYAGEMVETTGVNLPSIQENEEANEANVPWFKENER